MSNFNFYAAINDSEARIVKTWAECKLIAVGQSGGDKKGAYTYKEAEGYLCEMIEQRDKRLERNKPKRNKYSGSPIQGKATLDHLWKYV